MITTAKLNCTLITRARILSIKLAFEKLSAQLISHNSNRFEQWRLYTTSTLLCRSRQPEISTDDNRFQWPGYLKKWVEQVKRPAEATVCCGLLCACFSNPCCFTLQRDENQNRMAPKATLHNSGYLGTKWKRRLRFNCCSIDWTGSGARTEAVTRTTAHPEFALT